MNILKGNAIVGQSGGPTAAINATLSGVIRGALAHSDVIGKIYGMRNGIEGFLDERIVDLSDIFTDDSNLSALELTPAAALGSCRKKLRDFDSDKETYLRLLELFKKYDIRYFFYIGGNDSMDTVLKLSKFMQDNAYEMRIIGVPKTVDNDLSVTDHTPGFGSAAKFVATTVKEILRDVSVYTVKAVTIVEIMGRDAGWLTASAALPVLSGGAAPDLIYLPEVAFDIDNFISDVKKTLEDHPAVLVAVSEGIRLSDGEYVGASGSVVDAFGHKALSGAGKVLENIVKDRIGCKVRSIELNLPQRCASHIASLTDINESVGVGRAAVDCALSGKTAQMMTIDRKDEAEYSVSYGSADISGIANAVRSVPREYINERGNGVTEECLHYLAPLIIGEVNPIYEAGMPKHFII
jgi:6-phosphofructokinase 1